MSLGQVTEGTQTEGISAVMEFGVFEALLATGNLLIPRSERSRQRKPPVCFA